MTCAFHTVPVWRMSGTVDWPGPCRSNRARRADRLVKALHARGDLARSAGMELRDSNTVAQSFELAEAGILG
jgi:hypothetical protein